MVTTHFLYLSKYNFSTFLWIYQNFMKLGGKKFMHLKPWCCGTQHILSYLNKDHYQRLRYLLWSNLYDDVLTFFLLNSVLFCSKTVFCCISSSSQFPLQLSTSAAALQVFFRCQFLRWLNPLPLWCWDQQNGSKYPFYSNRFSSSICLRWKAPDTTCAENPLVSSQLRALFAGI